MPAVSRTADAPAVHICSHGHGDIQLEIPLHIADEATSTVIDGAQDLFYSEREKESRETRELQRRAGQVPADVEPAGVKGETAPDGRIVLHCTFRAVFPLTWENGAKQEVRIDVYPDGEFHIWKDGCVPRVIPSRELFPAPPYLPDRLRGPVIVKLRKSP